MSLSGLLKLRKTVSALKVLQFLVLLCLLQTSGNAQNPNGTNLNDGATTNGGINPFTQTVNEIKAALPDSEFAIPVRPIESHPERLMFRIVYPKAISARNSVIGPFTNYQDFKSRGITFETVSVVSYEIRGLPRVRVEMPEPYARLLESARVSSETGRILGGRLQLADLPSLIDELPNRLYFNRYFLSDKPNPEDDWSTQTYQARGFVSVTAMYPNGLFCLFKVRKTDPFLRADFMHEWSHQLRYKYAAHAVMKDFDSAVRFESDWSPNQYANRSATECFAVFGERLLSASATEFVECCERAPIRSTLWMQTLKMSLDKLQPQYRSVNHAQYLKRIEYALSKTKTAALASLRLRRNDENDPAKQTILDELIGHL